MGEESLRVIIGMERHKRSVTIEVIDGDEPVLGVGRFATDAAGYRSMMESVRVRPDRVWTIEGCTGIGRHIARRLIPDGEQVVEIPAEAVRAGVGVFATGQGRKTDATDAHSVALVGTRMTGLRPVVADGKFEVLRLLLDRRRSVGEEHTRKVAPAARLVAGAHSRWGEGVPVRCPDPQAAGIGASPATWSASPARVGMERVADLEKIFARGRVRSSV